jgi:hypothetical protein
MVATSNVIDPLDAYHVAHWSFLDSTNFSYMRSVVGPHGVGPAATKLLLIAATVAEAIGALLSWRALLTRGETFGRRAMGALCWSALLWSASVFMTELFTAYTSEPAFRELLPLTFAGALVLTSPTNDKETS